LTSRPAACLASAQPPVGPGRTWLARAQPTPARPAPDRLAQIFLAQVAHPRDLGVRHMLRAARTRGDADEATVRLPRQRADSRVPARHPPRRGSGSSRNPRRRSSQESGSRSRCRAACPGQADHGAALVADFRWGEARSDARSWERGPASRETPRPPVSHHPQQRNDAAGPVGSAAILCSSGLLLLRQMRRLFPSRVNTSCVTAGGARCNIELSGGVAQLEAATPMSRKRATGGGI
jgi:hypothetical protein